VIQAADAIERQLAAADPTAAVTFQTNLATFLAAERDQVQAVIDRIRAKYAGTAIAYTERVPEYLIQDAGLALGIPASFAQAIEDGSDPSPGDTAAFQGALRHHSVKVLLYNAQVTSPITQALRALAETNHVPVIGVSETLPPDMKNFQTWQADQANALLTALGG
jgi:zinc/manganese transport system substrate-binding protein